MSFTDRVRRPKQFDTLMQRLGGQSDKAEKAFDSLKSVLMFSASLAVAKGLEQKPFEQSAEKISLSVFSGPFDRAFIAALALSRTKDVSILHPERVTDQIQIFEEMAAAGLEWIDKEIESYAGEDEVYFRQLVATIGYKEQDIIDNYL